MLNNMTDNSKQSLSPDALPSGDPVGSVAVKGVGSIHNPQDSLCFKSVCAGDLQDGYPAGLNSSFCANERGGEGPKQSRSGNSNDTAKMIPTPGLWESSSQGQPSVTPANHWKYHYPRFFTDDNFFSQAFSQEKGELCDMECIIECSESNEDPEAMLWYIHWVPDSEGHYPDNEWVDTESLKHCKNALIFFLAILSEESSRFSSAMKDVERCGLFTKEDFDRYCRLNGALIHARRRSLKRAQYREEELLYGKKRQNPVPPPPQPNQPPKPRNQPDSTRRDQLVDRMVEDWAKSHALDLPKHLSPEERQIRILEEIVTQTREREEERNYRRRESRKSPKH